MSLRAGSVTGTELAGLCLRYRTEIVKPRPWWTRFPWGSWIEPRLHTTFELLDKRTGRTLARVETGSGSPFTRDVMLADLFGPVDVA